MFATAFGCACSLLRAAEKEPSASDATSALPDGDPMAEIESAVARIRTSYEQLRLRMDEKDRQLRRARAAQQAAETRRRELETRVQDLESENLALQTRVGRLETDLDDARRRAERTAAELRELDDRLQAAHRDLRRLTQERDELVASLQRERSRADEADTERLRLRAAVRDLERRLRSATEPESPTTELDETPVDRMPESRPPPEPDGSVTSAPAPITVVPRPVPELPAATVAAVPVPPEPAALAAAGGASPPPVPTPILSSTAAPPPAAVAASPMTLVPADEVDEAELTRLLVLAAAAREEGRWADARALYAQALNLRPGDAVAATGLAETLLEAGELTAADRLARDLLAAAPDHPDRLLLAGRIAARLGRADEALRQLRQARERAPLRADIARELGAAFHDAGRFDEAAVTFIAAAGLDPDDGLSWFNAAVCLLKTTPPNRRRAADCYRRAIELGEPNDERIEQRLREPDTAP